MEPRGQFILPALFCAGGLVLAYRDMVLSGFSLIAGERGDTRFNHYLLEHAYRWLLGYPGHKDFWNPAFYWPAKNATAYSDVMLGAGPLYWPWRLLGAAPDTALQLWILAVGALNFGAMYLLLHQGFEHSPPGASVGAALFAFGSPRIAQTGHYALFPHFWSIASLAAIVVLFASREPASKEQQRWSWLWIFCLGAAGQLWTGLYLGWFLALGLASALLGALASPRWRAKVFATVGVHPIALILAVLGGVLVVFPIAKHWLAAGRQVGMRSFEETFTMIPHPRTWLFMGRDSWLYGWMADLPAFQGIPMEHEQHLGFGLATSALAVTGLWVGRRDARVAWFGALGIAFLALATQVRGVTAWKLLFDVFPAAKAIRAVSRIGVMLLIPVAVGVSCSLTRLGARGGLYALGALPLGILALLEQVRAVPMFEKQRNRDEIASIVERIDRTQCDAFVFSPRAVPAAFGTYSIDAMWAQMESGIPTLNGYSGNNPPGWPLADTVLNGPADEARVASAIDQWVRTNRLDSSRTCWVRLDVRDGPYGAAFVGQRVPAIMVAGERYPVEVTLRNSGTNTWSRGDAFRLGSQAPQDNRQWGRERVDLPLEVALPGSAVTFRFDVNAPPEPGTHQFQWQMVRERVRWFGERTPPVAVTVTPR